MSKFPPTRRAAILASIVVLMLTAAAAAQTDPLSKAGNKAPFGTPAEEKALIANVCGTQLPTLGAAGCACLSDRAMTDLDQPERNYLILTVVQPQAADRTATARSPAELKKIAGFIETAGKDCAPPAAAPAEAPKTPAP